MPNKPTEFINTMVTAGAGAGKTYGLIHKIVDLVRESVDRDSEHFPRFVVTTFTRKATQEVRERLLSKALELRRTDPVFGEIFLNFLKSSGFLMVSTIHGVLNLFLKQYGSLIGLNPDFKVKPSSPRLLTQTLHELFLLHPTMMTLVKKYGWKNLKFFLLEYHKAKTFNPRMEGLPDSYFYGFWERKIKSIYEAALDLLRYIEPLLAQTKGESLSKFYGGLNDIIYSLNEKKELWSDFESLKKIYQKLPRNLGPLKQWDESYKNLRTQMMDDLAVLNDDFLTIKENFIHHHQDALQLQELGLEFSQMWFKKKLELGELDIEDLELLSLYILRHYPEQTKKFSESWNYWFIDEYQDTSPIQVQILNDMIGACPHYVVGDPQQSIYFFRGARSKVFYEKLNLFKKTQARIEEKKINRRSFAPTLYFINDLMDQINKHQFSPMDSLSDNETKDLLAGHFYLTPDKNEELHFNQIIKVLMQLLEEGVPPSQIAILCRENSELQRVYDKIRSAGLPAQVYSKGRFLEDRQVRDALCLWHFLVNPYDDMNLVELLRSPWFRVSDQILLEVSFQKSDYLWNRIQTLDLEPLLKLRQGLQDLSHESHFWIWQKLLIDSVAFYDCTQQDPSGRKEANLWKLISIIHDEIKMGTLDYADPLNRALSLENQNENEAPSIRESHQIQLMTIHGAKGLEFEHVILPFLNHSRKKESTGFFTTDLESQYWVHSFMNESNRTTQSHYFARVVAEAMNSLLDDEFERLFYVAITRAKRGLYFFCPSSEDELSKTGWARHLQSFISKGSGRFVAESGRYEFQVEDLLPGAP